MAALIAATDAAMWSFLSTLIMAIGGGVAWLVKTRREARHSTITELRDENERIRGIVSQLETKYATLELRLDSERENNMSLREEAMRSAIRAEDAQRRVEELIAENNALRERIRQMEAGNG